MSYSAPKSATYQSCCVNCHRPSVLRSYLTDPHPRSAPTYPQNQRRESGSQGRKAPDPEGVDGRERGASIARVGALIDQC